MQLAAGDVRSLVNTATSLLCSSFCSDAYIRPEDFRQPVYICLTPTTAPSISCTPQRLLNLQDTDITIVRPPEGRPASSIAVILSSNLLHREAPPPLVKSKIHQRLGPRLNLKYCLRHFAHPSLNFKGAEKSEI